ncbi:MAG: Na/Pi cotransporter family protein [Methanoregula sp.]|jgi:phosphate:Na+ symporter
MISWDLIFAIIPGIILFLYGIEQFSKEVQLAAGEYFRSLIQRLTKTPVRGTVAGALVTALVQSSTATTVITVGLVNAGIISFTASLGIIFGANLGTTLTSQLVALNLTAFAPILILAGFLLGIIGGKYKVFGRPVFYFGLVFFSLSLISGVMEPYRTDPQLIALIGMLDSVFLQIAFGFLITTIFQSSSVTTGLVVVMSQNGLITPTMAIPILLGANLGTPTTALLVAARMNTSAKRAAVAHFLFNFFGVLIFLPILGPFTSLVESLGGTPGQQVANAHLIFNLSCCIVFLILVKPFARLVTTIVKGDGADVVFVTKAIKKPLPEKTPGAFAMIENEITNLLSVSRDLLSEFRQRLNNPKQKPQRAHQLNDYALFLDSEISETALELSGRPLCREEAEYIAGIVRISKLGTVLAGQVNDLYGLVEQIDEKEIELPADSTDAIRQTLAPLENNLSTLIRTFPQIPQEDYAKMQEEDDRLRVAMNLHYRHYLARLSTKKTPEGSTLSRALFEIELMAGTIREIRKSLVSLSRGCMDRSEQK